MPPSFMVALGRHGAQKPDFSHCGTAGAAARVPRAAANDMDAPSMSFARAHKRDKSLPGRPARPGRHRLDRETR
jgi:hypothetical protein